MAIIEIHPDKIGDVIGPGGKVVKKIQSELNVKVDIEQTGRIFIAAPDQETADAARKMIEDITRDIAEGEVYVGKVIDIKPIGAIVELAPGRDGMIHISQLAHERVGRVEDVVNIGDEVVVKVIERDPSGKVRLSRRAMLPAPEPGEPGSEPRPPRPPPPERPALWRSRWRRPGWRPRRRPWRRTKRSATPPVLKRLSLDND